MTLTITTTTSGIKLSNGAVTITANNFLTKKTRNIESLAIVFETKPNYAEFIIQFSDYDNIIVNGTIVSDITDLQNKLSEISNTENIQDVNYNVSNGDHYFDAISFSGTNHLVTQFFYTSLNQTNHKLRLQISLDNTNFIDYKDSAGNVVETTIDNSLTNDIIKVSDFSTKYFRWQFVEGTTGTGTIDTFIIIQS